MDIVNTHIGTGFVEVGPRPMSQIDVGADARGDKGVEVFGWDLYRHHIPHHRVDSHAVAIQGLDVDTLGEGYEGVKVVSLDFALADFESFCRRTRRKHGLLGLHGKDTHQ